MAFLGMAELAPEQIVRLEEDGPAVVLLDQRRLPDEVVEVRCASAAEVADAIRTMVVRGAPAIGIAVAYGLALAALCGTDLAEIVSAQRGEREPVGSRDPDRRRASHGHVPDRNGDLRRRRAAHLDDLVRQPALVEEDDCGAVVFEANDLLGLELAHHVPKGHVRYQVPDVSARDEPMRTQRPRGAALLRSRRV